jgi:hypothetical protein
MYPVRYFSIPDQVLGTLSAIAVTDCLTSTFSGNQASNTKFVVWRVSYPKNIITAKR